MPKSSYHAAQQVTTLVKLLELDIDRKQPEDIIRVTGKISELSR